MAVSERDRDYFRQIGALKEASHAEAAAAQQKRTLGERLRRSEELSVAYRRRGQAPREDDDPTPFYDRARALGLYRP
ncbi:MAG TPA: hypothetical protein VF395_14625 [Polyangiaceae bacterium]